MYMHERYIKSLKDHYLTFQKLKTCVNKLKTLCFYCYAFVSGSFIIYITGGRAECMKILSFKAQVEHFFNIPNPNKKPIQNHAVSTLSSSYRNFGYIDTQNEENINFVVLINAELYLQVRLGLLFSDLHHEDIPEVSQSILLVVLPLSSSTPHHSSQPVPQTL